MLYRDACNWKTSLDVVVSGHLDREAIEPYLHEGEYLIPADVGLPELELDDPDINTDHPWYEIPNIEPTNEEPSVKVTAQDLLTRFQIVKWDELGAMRRLGLL